MLNEARVSKIEVRDVSVSYGDTIVLERTSFDVKEHEVVSLIGASGCGKTTLLHVIAGLASLTQGTVLVDGVAVTRPGPDRVMVFQDDAVFPWMTVQENAEYGLRIKGFGRDERQSRIQQVLELVGLADQGKLYPRELSGGMRKRVDLARALAVEPDIVLMDEPYGSLDAMTKERLQVEFLRIHHEKQMTTVFVTHDLEEAVFLGHRVMAMGTNPGYIASILDVPFGDLRPAELKLDTEFQRLRGELAERLVAAGSLKRAPILT